MKIQFKHPLSNGGQIVFNATLVAMRISDRAGLIVVPERVTKIPFPPFGGCRALWVKPEIATRAF